MKPADRTDYLASVPSSARGIVARAFSGKASPRSAIKAKCLDCSHFDRPKLPIALSCSARCIRIGHSKPCGMLRNPLRSASFR